MRARVQLGTVGLIVAGLVAASCSGSSDEADKEFASKPTSAAATTQTPQPNESTTPAATAVATTPPTTEAAPPQPNYLSGDTDYLFDQEQLHTFEIDLANDALAELDADPAAEEYVEGSLTFDGETIGPIGVRYKGSIGSFLFCTDGPNPFAPSGPKICTKLSMKLKINWKGSDNEFYGVKKIQLHSQNLDTTKMHERLGYWLFREMGVPAPRSTHARVIVNGEYVGLFALTEQIDGRFTRENFEDGSGNLYKEAWPFDGDSLPRRSADLIDSLKTNEDEDPSTEIMDGFTAQLAAAAPGEALDVLASWLDVDEMLRTFVVDRAIKNDDGSLHWYCFPDCDPHNFYWYEDPTARRVHLIPWDLDNSFENLLPTPAGSLTSGVTRIGDLWGEITDACEPFPFGSLNLLQRSAACDPIIGPLSQLTEEYDAIRAELLAGPFAVERIEAQLATWTAQIESSVAEAAEAHDDAPSSDAWREALELFATSLDDSRASNGR